MSLSQVKIRCKFVKKSSQHVPQISWFLKRELDKESRDISLITCNVDTAQVNTSHFKAKVDQFPGIATETKRLL